MNRKRVLIGALMAVAVGLIASQALAVGPPWSVFGTATPVRSGDPPNPWAVRLDSQGFATFGGVDFEPHPAGLTFNGIYYFGSDFRVHAGDCGGGSSRFQLNIDTDGNGTFDGNVFVYFGPSPAFTLCNTVPPGMWQTTGNLVGNNDICRYDTSQIVTGTQCNTYTGAQAIFNGLPNHQVLGINLVVDSGWFIPVTNTQTIDVDKVIVNQHILMGRGFFN